MPSKGEDSPDEIVVNGKVDRVSRRGASVPMGNGLDKIMSEESSPAGDQKMLTRDARQLLLEVDDDMFQVVFDDLPCAVHDRQLPFFPWRYCATVPNFTNSRRETNFLSIFVMPKW